MTQPVNVEVDGQLFEVRERPDGSGHHDFTWLSGPNPGYGFSSKTSDGSPHSQTDLVESIRSFLAQVDPATGYIE
ncbi:hypothetical protein [Kribbella sp. CA-293567]|uniref:hypothetical protein n=1 Tax=Kribbella sp. CA-293567 TaxID=3002436 RepID=UPI0022DD41AC|nr:hypothetical protein [Kribbella sp. CA-293567]WBQ06785.1 hypothetical protein OX958_08315 [Kribbella sp. CA-293567]